MLKFKLNKRDNELVEKISNKWKQLLEDRGIKIDIVDIQMDLAATHLNGCPLDLDKLFSADDFNLSHDMVGIHNHINRDTGKLEGYFLPRCAARKSEEKK